MAPKSAIIGSNEVELLYCKSKVYLHPTTTKKDNIPGFLTLSRGQNATNNDILLSFTPETQLSSKELKIYNEVDLDDITLKLEALSLKKSNSSHSKAVGKIVAKPSTSILTGYAFSVPLSFVYSIQIRKPSLGWWYGSIIIHTREGEKLPILFFHDDESQSTIKQQKLNNQNFSPFGEDGEILWGGSEFINIINKFVTTEQSTREPSILLVNPDSNDLRNFAPNLGNKASSQNNNQEPFKLPDVSKIFNNAKWKVLEAVASFSSKTKKNVVELVDEHAPDQVKQIMKINEVKRLSEEFDSARVYLAKWAAQVKEEAEVSQRKFMLDDEIYNKINKEIGSSELLTEEEINTTSRRKVVSKVEWDGFFDYSGRLLLTSSEVKTRIFHGGLEDSIRGDAWLFLLGVYPWDSSEEERKVLRASYETAYDELKLKWISNDAKRNEEFWKDQKHRIEKDIHRTDRNLLIFKNNKKEKLTSKSISTTTTSHIHESSPNEEEIDDDVDADDEYNVSNLVNPHLFKMREILLTYNEYNLNLGYVQGMTDLLSPLYVKFQDESLTFWAFTKFMDRMERNFVRDQSGMKKQMLTLNELVRFMLPDLFKHLESCESADLFFFFRMLLVWFKREFEWDDVLKLWETLWTDTYSSQYHLFIALAVLSDNERIIRENLTRFDEVLKYMNDLSMKMNLDRLLIRAELLFLRFRRMVDIIDRENSNRAQNEVNQAIESESINKNNNNKASQISPDLRKLLSRDIIIQKEVERPEGVGGG